MSPKAKRDSEEGPKKPSMYTLKLTKEQAVKLRGILQGKGWEPFKVDHAAFAFKAPGVNVVHYTSGKCVVSGKDTQEFVQFTLEGEVTGEAKMGYEAENNPEWFTEHLGLDESGKGDFFGPLCVAGVYVNRPVLEAWKNAGIRDSKSIGSDAQVAKLARVIRETPGCVSTVVPIGNEAYNRMHGANGSVNRVLAWGHARVIENLLGQRHRLNPPPVRAISDQFAASKATVEKALMALGRELELVQRHRAEEDLAVAAASILARDEFVTRLQKLETQFGVRLPKGASAAVEAAAREFVARHGAEALPKVAKMHFRTRYRVLGQPEPPRVEWRRDRPAAPADGAGE